MPPGFVWSAKAVKNLAGNGAIYVRLLIDVEEESKSKDEKSDSSLPSCELKGNYYKEESE